jgi:polysaccharide biosynthesis/export protein
MNRRASQQEPPRPRWPGFVLLCGVVLLLGCATTEHQFDCSCLAEGGADSHDPSILNAYQVGCPDVLAVQVARRPDMTGLHPVAADGRINLGTAGAVRVEGLTVPEIIRAVALEAEVPLGAVTVRVAENRSQFVYLFGEVAGLQRPVPYVGPETVLDLLQRCGGITPGAAPHKVYVIRPHVSDGGNPEVFHIDLEAILHCHDPRTNIRVQPFDQVYVGESHQASYARCIPPCFRSLYDTLWGMRREGG